MHHVTTLKPKYYEYLCRRLNIEPRRQCANGRPTRGYYPPTRVDASLVNDSTAVMVSARSSGYCMWQVGGMSKGRFYKHSPPSTSSGRSVLKELGRVRALVDVRHFFQEQVAAFWKIPASPPPRSPVDDAPKKKTRILHDDYFAASFASASLTPPRPTSAPVDGVQLTTAPSLFHNDVSSIAERERTPGVDENGLVTVVAAKSEQPPVVVDGGERAMTERWVEQHASFTKPLAVEAESVEHELVDESVKDELLDEEMPLASNGEASNERTTDEPMETSMAVIVAERTADDFGTIVIDVDDVNECT